MGNQSNCNPTKFRQLVTDATKDFKRITNGMIDVSKYFRHVGHDYLATLIMSLQDEEENRLQLSAKLRMAKQEASDNSDQPNFWNKVAHLKELYNNSIQMITELMEKLRTETNKFSY